MYAGDFLKEFDRHPQYSDLKYYKKNKYRFYGGSS